ncbi:MAG: PQQ-binding-like beta-propeller repeat protein [Candidatus Brocadiae bacterium]|nr:PQQ-binding-like beta-propeller repeat protein [Candidatus Brocadiia bacterium]
MKQYLFFFLFFIFSYCIQVQEIFLLPLKSEEALELFQEAAQKAKNKDWESAIDSYLLILQKYPEKLVFLENKLYVNASNLAVENLSSLPKEAQIILSNKINILLKQAKNKQTNPFPFLYPFLATEKGQEVWMQWIAEIFLKEEYQNCISYLQYLANPLFNHSITHSGRAKLAFCYYALGYEDQLAFWKKFYEKNKAISIALGKDPIKLTDYIESLSQKIQERQALLSPETSWHLYGKNLSGNFSTKQTLSSLRESYSKKLPYPERPQEPRYFYNERPRNAEGPVSMYPIVGDGSIFINNGQKIQAYDLFLSNLRWEFAGLIPQLKTEKHEQVIHTLTYHNGYLYANIEGDTPGQQKDTWNAYKIKDVIAERRLIKLDASNGRFLWQVKDEKGDEEAFANKASFVTPPLVWGKYLYAGASELSGLFNSYVVAVHPENGKIAWKTLIGSAQQELNMFGNPVRETVGTPLAGGNGCLYYLNNLGAFSCIDPISGNLLWLYNYDRIKLQKPNNPLFETIYRHASWHNSPVILYEDKVYFAPVDSEYIYCLHARTGERIWQKFRSGYQYFMLAAENKILLGGKSIAFLDASTGDILSILSLNSENVEGMGVRSGNLFYCPCNKSLYCIDIAKEKIQDSWKWNHSMVYPGNIVMVDSALISVSREYLNVFYDLQAIATILQKQLEKNSQDSTSYIKLADLYLQLYSKDSQEGLLIKAEELYLKSLDLLKASEDSNANIQTSKAQKGLLLTYQTFSQQRDREGNRRKSHEYDLKALALSDDPFVCIPLFLRMYEYYFQNKEYTKAKECLEELINKYGRETYSLRQEGNVLLAIYAYSLLANQYETLGQAENAMNIFYTIFTTYSDKQYKGISAQDWAKKNIARLIQKFGQAIYQKYDEEALEAYRKLQQIDYNSSSLKRILSHYPNTQYASMIYYTMIQKILEEGTVRLAVEEMEYFLREYPDAPETPYIYKLLIQTYESYKNFSHAKILLKRFKAKYEGQRFALQKEDLDVNAFVQEKTDHPEYRKIQEKSSPVLSIWKEGNVKHTFSEPNHTTLRLLSITGITPSQQSQKVFFSLGNTLICRDAKTSEKIWANSDMGWIYSLGFLDSSLFAWSNNQLFRLDANTGKVLWEASIPYRFASIALGSRKIAVICENYGQNTSTLYVRSAESQEVLWKDNFPGKITGDAIIADNFVIVFSQNPSVLKIYDIDKGKVMKEFPTIPGARRYWDYYPVLCGQYLCVVVENRWIECYEISSMKMLWKHDAESLFIPSGAVPSKPFLSATDDSIVFLEEKDSITSLSVSQGETQWKLACQSYSIRKILSGIQGIYVVVRKEEGNQIWSLSSREGSMQWIASLPDVFATIDILLSEEYLVAMMNRYAQGYQSAFYVFQKSNGERVKEEKVKGGDRGRTYSEMTIAGGNLWVVKDNIVWILGE